MNKNIMYGIGGALLGLTLGYMLYYKKDESAEGETADFFGFKSLRPRRRTIRPASPIGRQKRRKSVRQVFDTSGLGGVMKGEIGSCCPTKDKNDCYATEKIDCPQGTSWTEWTTE